MPASTVVARTSHVSTRARVPSPGFAAHRLQRMTLAGLHLSPMRGSAVTQARLAWHTRPRPTVTRAMVEHEHERASRVPWNAIASCMAILAFITLAIACADWPARLHMP